MSGSPTLYTAQLSNSQISFNMFTWSASAKLAVLFPGFFQPSALFLSRVLLLGFGKLLSIKKKCHCLFVAMCLGFTTNCQNKSRSKSVAFLHATTHTVALAGTCTSLILFTMKITSRHTRSYGHTQNGVIQRLAQTRAKTMTSKFHLSNNLHSLLSPDLNVKFNVLSLFFRRM